MEVAFQLSGGLLFSPVLLFPCPWSVALPHWSVSSTGHVCGLLLCRQCLKCDLPPSSAPLIVNGRMLLQVPNMPYVLLVYFCLTAELGSWPGLMSDVDLIGAGVGRESC